jgi:Ca-activated chloride channel homolog
VQKSIILLVPLLFTSLFASGPWFPARKAHQAYLQKDYLGAKDILQNEQAEKPDDLIINFNLGTVYYKERNYEAAKDSFLRTITNAAGDHNLLEKAYFNLGNTLYQNALAPLPENWEKEIDKLDEKVKNQAITDLKSAIEKYTLALKQNKTNERTKANKAIAEKTLAKLEKKQNQQNKDQKDNQNKNKQDKDQQKDKNNQDQNKENQQDKDKQQQDKNNQDKDQNKNDQQQDKQENNQQNKDNQQQDKKEQKQQDQQKDQQQNKKDQQDQQQEQGKKDEKEQQSNQPRNLEERKTEAVLAQLQQAEKDLQKKLFAQKVQMSKKSNNKYQKPW